MKCVTAGAQKREMREKKEMQRAIISVWKKAKRKAFPGFGFPDF
jgi:hypothetical protein